MKFVRKFGLNRYEAALVILVVVYSVMFSFITLMRFYTFRTYVDLGIFDQAFSSAFHGRLFYETPDLLVIRSGSLLGTHFSLLLFLLLPLYMIVPRPETLLVVQTLFIALGALPIFLISRLLLKSQRLSLALTSAYLLSPAIQSMNMFDFHLEAFLPFFLGMFYFSLLKQKWWGYVLFVSLSLVTIEFGPVMVFAISVSYLMSNLKIVMPLLSKPRTLFSKEYRHYSFPLVTMPVSVAAFYLSLTAAGYLSGTSISPQSAVSGFLPTLDQWLGADYALKVAYWGILLGGVVFLPLRVPSRLLMVAPWMVVTVLTTTPAFTEIGYQHAGAFVAPFLIVAAAYAMRGVNGRRATSLLVVVMILFCTVTTPLDPLVHRWIPGIAYEDGLPIPTSHDMILYRVIDLVPSNASILTQNNLFSHFSNRPNAYVYLPNNETAPSFILGDNKSSWYTIATVPPLTWHTYGSYGVRSVSDAIGEALSNGTYGIIADADGVILLEAGYKGPVLVS